MSQHREASSQTTAARRTRLPWTAGLMAALAALVLAGPSASHCVAQSGTLVRDVSQGAPLTLKDASFYYMAPPPPRTIQKHDIITVVVNIRNAFLSEAEVQRRKRANYDAKLLDWFDFQGLSLRPGLQNGDPAANGQLNTQYRAENEIETIDRLQFTIAARVKDVRPNGNIVIEAQQTVQNNDEIWEQTLTGEVRPEDVLPNNRVLSENVSDLTIHKREMGHVRDAYRRGWFMKFWDRVSPF
jgi:flagellar L-ring protein precursor FlgH